MADSTKKIKLVGEFIRRRREVLDMSQRSLGMLFEPAVTTQFISNVERGVTPLPLIHIPVLAKALNASESEITSLLEKEYTLKLNGRLGRTEEFVSDEGHVVPGLVIEKSDYDFMRTLYDAYRVADPKTREAFGTVCESILKLPKVRHQH